MIATRAAQLCGLSLRRLARGGPFDVRMGELAAYASEFLAAELAEAGGTAARDKAAETRTRSAFVGFHPRIAELRRRFVRYLDSPLPIMLIGDRGTGKGALVRAAAKALGASDLFTVALAGVPDSLAESELFGHRKGAFTGADRDRTGILRTAAQKGSIVYLDDVAECSPSLQAKLLTALEEGIVRPVGSDREHSFGSGLDRRFRIVSSSHPGSLGKLRLDLRDRLTALPLSVPPLRRRGADILLLAARASELVSRGLGRDRVNLSAKACETLVRFDWPGNVRQLFNVIGRAIVLHNDGDSAVTRGTVAEVLAEETRLSDLSSDDKRARSASPKGQPAEWPTLAEVEERYIADVLEATGGRLSAAARILGVHRSTVRRRRKGE